MLMIMRSCKLNVFSVMLVVLLTVTGFLEVQAGSGEASNADDSELGFPSIGKRLDLRANNETRPKFGTTVDSLSVKREGGETRIKYPEVIDSENKHDGTYVRSKWYSKAELERAISKHYPQRCKSQCRIKLSRVEISDGFSMKKIKPVPVKKRPPDPGGKDDEDEKNEESEQKQKLKNLLQQLMNGERRVINLANLDPELREALRQMVDGKLPDRIRSVELLNTRQVVPDVNINEARRHRGEGSLPGANWALGSRKPEEPDRSMRFESEEQMKETNLSAEVIRSGGGDTIQLTRDDLDWTDVKVSPASSK